MLSLLLEIRLFGLIIHNLKSNNNFFININSYTIKEYFLE